MNAPIETFLAVDRVGGKLGATGEHHADLNNHQDCDDNEIVAHLSLCS